MGVLLSPLIFLSDPWTLASYFVSQITTGALVTNDAEKRTFIQVLYSLYSLCCTVLRKLKKLGEIVCTIHPAVAPPLRLCIRSLREYIQLLIRGGY